MCLPSCASGTGVSDPRPDLAHVTTMVRLAIRQMPSTPYHSVCHFADQQVSAGTPTATCGGQHTLGRHRLHFAPPERGRQVLRLLRSEAESSTTLGSTLLSCLVLPMVPLETRAVVPVAAKTAIRQDIIHTLKRYSDCGERQRRLRALDDCVGRAGPINPDSSKIARHIGKPPKGKGRVFNNLPRARRESLSRWNEHEGSET